MPTGRITRGTTIGGARSANPGDVVTLGQDTFNRLRRLGDIEPCEPRQSSTNQPIKQNGKRP